jgi:hypothetical protein
VAIPKTKRRKMKKVNPKPAAKVDDAAKVLLTPRPPPPFRSATPPRNKDRSNIPIFVAFAFVIAALAVLVFLNYWPK